MNFKETPPAQSSKQKATVTHSSSTSGAGVSSLTAMYVHTYPLQQEHIH